MDSLSSLLRPILTPITHNLPSPIANLGISILGPTCYAVLLTDIDLSSAASAPCLRLALSKGLGIGIIAASSVVKVPQILKLLNSRSAAGISFLSYALETSSYLVGLAYNYRSGNPFSTYGETSFILVQNVVISLLVLQYSGRSAAAALFVAALAVAGAALLSEGVMSMQALSYAQAGAGVLSVASKVPQIVTVWREGTTGQLSAFAVFNYLAGSLTRIYTTLQEVDDPLILYGFVAGFVLNAVLAAQMLYYWNAPSVKAKGKMKELPMASGLRAGDFEDTASAAASDVLSGTSTGTATPKGKSPSTRRRG